MTTQSSSPLNATKFTERLEDERPVTAFRIPADLEQECKVQPIRQFSKSDDVEDTPRRTIHTIATAMQLKDNDKIHLVAVYDSHGSCLQNTRGSIFLAMFTGDMVKIFGDVCIYAAKHLKTDKNGDLIELGEPSDMPEDLGEMMEDALSDGPFNLLLGDIGKQVFQQDPGRLIEIVLKAGMIDIKDMLGGDK